MPFVMVCYLKMKLSFFVLLLAAPIQSLTVSSDKVERAFEAALVTEGILVDFMETDATPLPLVTPYQAGFLIDAIPPDPNVSPGHCCLFQLWAGSLNWLVISTCPDLTTAVSFFSSFKHNPSAQYMEAACYVGCYLLSTIDRGIAYSFNQHTCLCSCVNILFKEDQLVAFSDTNWGPQDQSMPSTEMAEVPHDKL
eukprot:15327052-Ditylum_brightwellii.AAC.2